MTRSLSPQSYGPEFEHLLVAAFANPPLTVPLPSERHAKTFRGKLYAYFSALRTANLRPDLIEKADALTLSVDGPAVTLSLRANSWEAVAIRLALGLSEGSVPELPRTTQDALLDKLAEIRKKHSKT